ncbi:MAG: hypothetical protein ACTHJ6_12670 [Oryzihumus sp.]
MADTGVTATIRRTIIDSQDQAQRRPFTGSPTILIKFSDPFARHAAPAARSCRLDTIPDGLLGIAALVDLQRALNRVAAG